MYHPILQTLLKMRPHDSQSSRENANPSSGTSPVASYKEVPLPPPPPPGESRKMAAILQVIAWRLKVRTHDATSPCDQSQGLVATCELATSPCD